MLSLLLGEDQRWLDQREHIAFLARANPDDPQALRALAQCLFNLQEYDAARGALDAALLLAPDDPDVLLLHANLLSKEGLREQGLQVLEQANAANARRIEEAEAKKGGSAAGASGAPPAKGPAPAEGAAPGKDAPPPKGAAAPTPAASGNP